MDAAAQIAARDPAAVGVWDTICTFGRYQHETVDGKQAIVVHDASTSKAMLDDFAAHPEQDYFYDKKHEVVDALGERAQDSAALQEWAAGDGHALGWGDAMVMIVGGQVARYVAHPSAPQDPPTIDELRQSDGSLRPDGVYGRRSVVTPRGADPSGGFSVFRHTSPFFVSEKDGNRLLCLTVTNDPRMRDCALAMDRTSGAVAMSRVCQPKRPAGSAMERTKMPENMDESAAVMQAAGCAAEDAPEAKMQKLSAYARKMEAERDEAKKTPPAVAPVKQDDQGAENAAMADMLAQLTALRDKIAMLEKELADGRATLAESAAMQRSSRAALAEQKAKQAIAMGRCRGDHKGTIEATEKWLAGKFEKGDAEAEDVLSKEGTFQISERVAMQRFTSRGSVEGSPNPAATPDEIMERLVDVEIKRMKDAGETHPEMFAVAMQRVRKANPEAVAKYLRPAAE